MTSSRSCDSAVRLVFGAQAAVAAARGAVVGDLDQPAQMDLVADVLLPQPIGGLPQLVQTLGVLLAEPIQNFGEGWGMRISGQQLRP